MATAAAYRDPLPTALERVAHLERENAELRIGNRRPRRYRFAGFLLLAAVMVGGPLLAWALRGWTETRAVRPAPATTYSGTYKMTQWGPSASSQTGTMVITVDRQTGNLRGYALGPIGSTRIVGRVVPESQKLEAIVVSGNERRLVEGHVMGDAMQGGFAVPGASASAWFALEVP